MNRYVRLPLITISTAVLVVSLYTLNKLIPDKLGSPLYGNSPTVSNSSVSMPTPTPSGDKPMCDSSHRECVFESYNTKVIFKNTQNITSPSGKTPLQEILVKNQSCEEFTIDVNTQEEAGVGVQTYMFNFIPNTNYMYYTTGGWEGIQTDIVDTCTGKTLLPEHKYLYISANPKTDFYFTSDNKYLIINNTTTFFGAEHNGLYLVKLQEPITFKILTESKSVGTFPSPDQSFELKNISLHENTLTWEEESDYNRVTKAYIIQ